MIRREVRLGERTLLLETGRIAKQAHGSCLVTCGETVVLVTVCGSDEPRAGIDFFPLSVDYVEKTYAAGKVPGGFFKREGRLRDDEILASRLIDRPCRPLFPEGYRNDVQVIATVLSADGENLSDVMALVGASAALHWSPLPWDGPIGGVRVGRIDGKWVANPTTTELLSSDCDIIVAASRDAIVMVEGECKELSEADLVEALFFGHQAVQPVIEAIESVQPEVFKAQGLQKKTFEAEKSPVDIVSRVESLAKAELQAACNIKNKHERYARFRDIKKQTVETLRAEFVEQEGFIKSVFEDLKYTTMRSQVLHDKRRIDGRDMVTVRPIDIEVGFLPRTHGSSLFTRGETQAIVTATLGTGQDEQKIDGLLGVRNKRFMLHYNFPPFSVGETRPMRGPGRREVGHGNLAERALSGMIPEKDSFPYTIRIVSEITESNGSSSMATVCGGALALMDAGVPLKAPVAGVAMGLIKEGDAYAVLTDILGDEDHLGDMDFKVCGTSKGVTAIQMDIKISGLSREILEKSLEQARQARIHVLSKMNAALDAPRKELSPYAPRITTIKVKPDHVRLVIGPGGKNIKGIIDATGVSIDIEDDGTVNIASSDGESTQRAIGMIEALTAEPEVGKKYTGLCKRIEPYGAFLEIMPNVDGLLHVSDIDWKRVEKVEDYIKLGEVMEVVISSIGSDGKVKLSRKDLLPKPEGYIEPPPRPPRERNGSERGGRFGGRRDDRPRR